MEKFREFVVSQGGDASFVDDTRLLPQAQYQIPVPALTDGFISDWVANEVGEAAMWLGAGRATKEDEIDPAVGLMIHAKVGDAVKQGDNIVTIYSNRENVDDVIAKLQAAVTISDSAEAAPLIYETIDQA